MFCSDAKTDCKCNFHTRISIFSRFLFLSLYLLSLLATARLGKGEKDDVGIAFSHCASSPPRSPVPKRWFGLARENIETADRPTAIAALPTKYEEEGGRASALARSLVHRASSRIKRNKAIICKSFRSSPGSARYMFFSSFFSDSFGRKRKVPANRKAMRGWLLDLSC